ncbi:hypothetical protein AAMO2058_000238200 [Amorphochlora amoebiformis]
MAARPGQTRQFRSTSAHTAAEADVSSWRRLVRVQVKKKALDTSMSSTLPRPNRDGHYSRSPSAMRRLQATASAHNLLKLGKTYSKGMLSRTISFHTSHKGRGVSGEFGTGRPRVLGSMVRSALSMTPPGDGKIGSGAQRHVLHARGESSAARKASRPVLGPPSHARNAQYSYSDGGLPSFGHHPKSTPGRERHVFRKHALHPPIPDPMLHASSPDLSLHSSNYHHTQNIRSGPTPNKTTHPGPAPRGRRASINGQRESLLDLRKMREKATQNYLYGSGDLVTHKPLHNRSRSASRERSKERSKEPSKEHSKERSRERSNSRSRDKRDGRETREARDTRTATRRSSLPDSVRANQTQTHSQFHSHTMGRQVAHRQLVAGDDQKGYIEYSPDQIGVSPYEDQPEPRRDSYRINGSTDHMHNPGFTPILPKMPRTVDEAGEDAGATEGGGGRVTGRPENRYNVRPKRLMSSPDLFATRSAITGRTTVAHGTFPKFNAHTVKGGQDSGDNSVLHSGFSASAVVERRRNVNPGEDARYHSSTYPNLYNAFVEETKQAQRALLAANKSLTSQNKSLERQVEQLKQDCKGLETRCSSLEEENKHLNDRMSAQHSTMTQKLTDADQHNQTLQEHLDLEKEKVSQLEERIKQLKEVLDRVVTGEEGRLGSSQQQNSSPQSKARTHSPRSQNHNQHNRHHSPDVDDLTTGTHSTESPTKRSPMREWDNDKRRRPFRSRRYGSKTFNPRRKPKKRGSDVSPERYSGKQLSSQSQASTAEEAGSEQDKEHIRMLIGAAGFGIPNAMVRLAECYINGTGVKKDTIKGFLLACKDKLMDHPKAAFLRARCYENGLGTEVDLKMAKAEYEKAMSLGDMRGLEAARRVQSALNEARDKGPERTRGSMITARDSAVGSTRDPMRDSTFSTRVQMRHSVADDFKLNFSESSLQMPEEVHAEPNSQRTSQPHSRVNSRVNSRVHSQDHSQADSQAHSSFSDSDGDDVRHNDRGFGNQGRDQRARRAQDAETEEEETTVVDDFSVGDHRHFRAHHPKPPHLKPTVNPLKLTGNPAIDDYQQSDPTNDAEQIKNPAVMEAERIRERRRKVREAALKRSKIIPTISKPIGPGSGAGHRGSTEVVMGSPRSPRQLNLKVPPLSTRLSRSNSLPLEDYCNTDVDLDYSEVEQAMVEAQPAPSTPVALRQFYKGPASPPLVAPSNRASARSKFQKPSQQSTSKEGKIANPESNLNLGLSSKLSTRTLKKPQPLTIDGKTSTNIRTSPASKPDRKGSPSNQNSLPTRSPRQKPDVDFTSPQSHGQRRSGRLPSLDFSSFLSEDELVGIEELAEAVPPTTPNDVKEFLAQAAQLSQQNIARR